MKKTNLVVLITLVTTLVLYSCQKEVHLQNDQPNTGGGGTSNNKSIIGDYDFAGIAADTRTTVLVADPLGDLKTISTSTYKSEANSGTVKFTSSQMVYTNVAYSINSTAHVKLYLAGALLNESDMPFIVPPAPISGTEDYVKNNNDSITFSRPIFIASNPFSSTITPQPMGAKISWSGDTLILKVSQTLNGKISQGGVDADFSGFFDGVMKFKKK